MLIDVVGGEQTIEVTGWCFDFYINNITVKLEQTELQCTLNYSLKVGSEIPLGKLGGNIFFVTYKDSVYESSLWLLMCPCIYAYTIRN